MRIVYLSASAQLGGAERSVLNVLASMRAARPDWMLALVVPGDGPLARAARSIGIPTTVVSLPPRLARVGDAAAGGPAGRRFSRLALLVALARAAPSIASYARRLRRALAGAAPDVLHTNGIKMHLLGVWARPRGAAVVWHVHDFLGARPVAARLLRWHAVRCAAVVANSGSVADDARRVCGSRTPVHVVYNGIDLQQFAPEGPALELDAVAGLPKAEPGVVRVGLLATFARWKGHETFLRALSLLPPGVPVRGYVVGGPLYQTDGSQYSLEELRRCAAALGVAERVGFTGFVDDPAAAIRALDVVVHASTEPEPFGLVIAEAMACGRAVIASQAGGAAEIISTGVDALAYPPGDAAALAACIRELAANGEQRRLLGRHGRATAERHFDRNRLPRDLVPIYLRHGGAGRDRAAAYADASAAAPR